MASLPGRSRKRYPTHRLTKSGLDNEGLGRIAGFAQAGFVDGSDAEFVLHALFQVRYPALRLVSRDSLRETEKRDEHRNILFFYVI